MDLVHLSIHEFTYLPLFDFSLRGKPIMYEHTYGTKGYKILALKQTSGHSAL